MKRTVYTLSALLFLFVFFLVTLYGASGHSFSLKDDDNLLYLILIALYSSTAGILLLFIRKGSARLKKGVIALIMMTLTSFFYLIYETLKVKIGDFAILIPLGILLAIIGLCLKLLHDLTRRGLT